MIERDDILTGVVIGAITPILGYIVVDGLIDGLMSMGWLKLSESEITFGKAYRTHLLLSICTILVPFHIAKYNRWDKTMRGMLFPVMIYVAAWVYKFYDQILAF